MFFAPSRRHVVALAIASCVLVLTFASFSAPAATPERGFFGVGGWSYPTRTQADDLAPAGLGLVRGAMDWDEIETRPGTRDWRTLDGLASSAAQHGFNLLIVLNGCARWACGERHRPPLAEPALGEYRAFVADAVSRYGAGGTYWATHRIAAPPRVMWQVWNEVNGGFFWPNPTAADYAPFLATIGQTIKSVDRDATVVSSGLVEKPGEASGVFLAPFLEALYAQPGYRDSFDVAAVHGYAPTPEDSLHILDVARRIMVAHGDGARPLWVTEMSWATGGPDHPFRVSESQQADDLRAAWDTMYACRARWNLQRVMWFSLQDVDPAVFDSADYWGFNNGLLRRDGSAKPAMAAFRQYLGAAPLPAGRGDDCGLPNGTTLDITDPDTTITALPGVVHSARNAAVSFTSESQATDAGVRFQCAVDGGDWVACRSAFPVPSEREGSHEIRVRAIDTQGNVDPTPATGSWMVDRTPPNTRLIRRSPFSTKNRVLSVSFVARDAVGVHHVECRYDRRRWARCKSPYRTPRLKPGLHVIGIRAVDTSGQTDPTPLTLRFKIKKPVPKRVAPRRPATRKPVVAKRPAARPHR